MLARAILKPPAIALAAAALLGAAAAQAQQVCTIVPWLPQDYAVFHVGTYSGTAPLDEPVELDNSGHTVKQVDVIVNYREKPVALVLTAYDPIVWKVRWAPGSKVVGVFVSGYHSQAIIGIPRWIPLLRTSYVAQKEHGPCQGIYNSGSNRDNKAPWTKIYAGKEAESSITAFRNGPTWVGEQDASLLPKLLSSDQYSLADFAVKRGAGEVVAGPAGLQELAMQGYLRQATLADFWLAMSPATILNRVLRGKFASDLPIHRSYVVLRKVTLPDGLYGAHSAGFIVPRGVPAPDGPKGHNSIYLAGEGMKCVSEVCRERN